MGNLKDGIKDLLGTTVQVKFNVPIDDNAQFNYDTKFGLQSNSNTRNGMLITNPPASPQTPIKLYAAFPGKLFFTSLDYNSGKIHGLHLVIFPAEALALRSSLPAISQPITEVIYIPVDKIKVETAIKKTLTKQGLSGAKLTSTLNKIMSGEGESLLVESGEYIGDAQGTAVKLMFLDSDNNVINPLYLVWTLWHLSQKSKGKFNPANHTIVGKLNFSSLNLDVNESYMVVDISQVSQLNFGPYSFLL
jgi:hypothetical protein